MFRDERREAMGLPLVKHDFPTVTYYNGVPIDKLTRDELIEAVNFLAHEVETVREQGRRDREFLFGIRGAEEKRHTKLLDLFENFITSVGEFSHG